MLLLDALESVLAGEILLERHSSGRAELNTAPVEGVRGGGSRHAEGPCGLGVEGTISDNAQGRLLNVGLGRRNHVEHIAEGTRRGLEGESATPAACIGRINYIGCRGSGA